MRRARRLPLLPRTLALCIGVWAAAALVTWDHLAPVRIGLYAAPLIMLAATALAGWALLHRARFTATAMMAVAAGLFLIHAPTLLRGTPQAPSEAAIRVVSLSNRTMNTDMAATARMVRAEQADLFILQEVAAPAELATAVDALPGPPLYHCAHHTYQIFSRYPLSPPHPGALWGLMACEAALPSGPVWVGSVHLPRGLRTRSEQLRVLDHIMALLEEMPGPKIIAGDFNATPLTTPIRRMEARLENAFAAAGQGFGFTFPTEARRIGAAGPFLQIDYIFHSSDFRTVSAQVKDTHPPAADHLPVQAVLMPARGDG